MNKFGFILMLVLTILLQGCESYHYCQLYEVDTDVEKKENALVYSDENCDIIYNLWDDSGSMDFIFTNKTDKDIIIDLTRSFFIQNGIAYDYYSDKEYTSTATIGVASASESMASYAKYGYTRTPYLWTPTSISRGAKVSSALTSKVESSVTTKTEKYIYVPAKASKIVKSFSISNHIYLVCGNDELNAPKTESEKITYTKNESPLNFRNKITYILNDNVHNVDNEFWITSVRNYNESYLKKTRNAVDCITKKRERKEYFRISGANMFYNNYDLTVKPKISR